MQKNLTLRNAEALWAGLQALRRKCIASAEIGVQITSFDHHSTFEMSEQVSSPSSEQAASPGAAPASQPKVARYATEADVLALMTNDKFKKFCKKKCGECAPAL